MDENSKAASSTKHSVFSNGKTKQSERKRNNISDFAKPLIYSLTLLEGEHVEEGAEVAAVVDLVADERAALLALGLRDAVRDHPRHRRVRVTFEKG